MKLSKIIRRFCIPTPLVSLLYFLKYRCLVSSRAEVEYTPNIKIGKKTQISSFCKIKASDGPLTIGDHVSIGTGCFLTAHKKGIEIGDYCLISPNVSIIGNAYSYEQLDVPIVEQGYTSMGIKLGRNVWIGSGSSIADGVTIGDNVIIAANSFVTSKIPENSVAQGNPAKVIFTRR